MNILIVDDHPLTVNAYRNMLNDELRIANIITAYDCKAAYEAIIIQKQNIDLAILDQNLPGYPDKHITSGSDLAFFIRQHIPKCKIVMLTSHTETLVVYDIMRRIEFEGLIIKNDINTDNFGGIIRRILEGERYKSELVLKCLQEIWRNEVIVEDYNRKILLYLSKGYKVKELETVISLTLSAIQKRISKMRKAFNVNDDNALIKEVIRQGYL